MGWPWRLRVGSLTFWVVALLFMAASSFSYFGLDGHDFRGYFAAALVVRRGGNPYDYAQVAAVLREVTGEVGNFPYYYPPWFAIALTPLTLLPFRLARALWLAGNVAFWVAGVAALSHTLGWPHRGWQRSLAFLAATYLFAWMTWRFEQLGVFLFFCLALTLWTARSHRPRWSGALLALALSKPTITVLPVLAVLLWWLRRRQGRALQGFAVTLFASLLLSAPLLPGMLDQLQSPGVGQGLVREMDGPGQVGSFRLTTTLPHWLAMSFSAPPRLITTMQGLALLVGVGLTLWAVSRATSLLSLLSVALLASYWVAPYALQYDFPPLAIPLFAALQGTSRQSTRARRVAALLLLATLSVPLWERPISDGFWIVVGITLLYGLTAFGHFVDRERPALETQLQPLR